MQIQKLRSLGKSGFQSLIQVNGAVEGLGNAVKDGKFPIALA